jgi:hypothetical protein
MDNAVEMMMKGDYPQYRPNGMEWISMGQWHMTETEWNQLWISRGLGKATVGRYVCVLKSTHSFDFSF